MILLIFLNLLQDVRGYSKVQLWLIMTKEAVDVEEKRILSALEKVYLSHPLLREFPHPNGRSLAQLRLPTHGAESHGSFGFVPFNHSVKVPCIAFILGQCYLLVCNNIELCGVIEIYFFTDLYNILL